MPLQIQIKEVDSTQLELKRRMLENPSIEHLSYVQADRQTLGKGRQERTWFSPEGNLFLSILLRGPHSSVTWIPLWVAVSLRNAMVSTFNLRKDVKLKWPNDLVVEPFSKISGILCEKVGEHVVAGIGVNVVVTPPVEGRLVTSVQECAAETLPNEAIARLRDSLLNELKKPFSIDQIRREFETHGLISKNDLIEWLDVGTQKTGSGRMIELGPYGELRVQQDDQTLSLFSEEVTQVKKC